MRLRAGVASLAGVLLHGIVDEVINRALELARHFLETLPERLAALKRAGGFGIRFAHELDQWLGRLTGRFLEEMLLRSKRSRKRVRKRRPENAA